MLKKLRVISSIVFASMLINVSSQSVFAFTDLLRGDPEPASTVRKVTSQKKQQAVIKNELVEKREKNVKHFLNEDLSYQAVMYPQAVHFMKDGKFEDVDNTLEEKTDNNGSQVLENKNNSYKVRIAKNAKSNNLVSIKKDGYDLSWSVDKVKTGKSNLLGQVVTDDSSLNESSVIKLEGKKQDLFNKLSPEKKKISVPKVSSDVKFVNIKSGIDLEYQVKAEKIKENIILNERANDFEISFIYNSSTLIPELQKDKSILFTDKNDKSKKVMKIPSPIMYDAKNKISRNIEVSLNTAGNKTTITLKPDSTWLSDKSRVYPVTIDPPVEIAIDADKIIDVSVDSSNPTVNCEGGDYLQTGNDGAGAIFRTYSKTTLTTLSSADMVTDATFDLGLFTDNDSSSQLNAYKVTSDWQPATLTWNTQPSYNSKIEDYEFVSGYSGDPFMWDITGVVKDWYATGNNYGLLFKSNDESIASGATYNEFYAAECFQWSPDYTPYLVLNYVNSSGLEDYFSYHSQNVGRAGDSYTNDYNGNVVLVHKDVAMSGNRFPISLNHVFNSNDKSTDLGYGSGWRLNVSQKITPVVIDGTSYYEYKDEDGTCHYFLGASNTWDESGINLKLTKNVDGTYLLIDKLDNKINFRTDGVISSAVDRNANALTYIYGSATRSYLKRIGENEP